MHLICNVFRTGIHIAKFLWVRFITVIQIRNLMDLIITNPFYMWKIIHATSRIYTMSYCYPFRRPNSTFPPNSSLSPNILLILQFCP
ncbi:hypothetical protein GDO81_008228 [Engystomops pustulosus]|uniref:Uncharacterized protein n=1 Tax=Engystomops pustulosus TaxID=76066 RepID=A0AAV7CF23_ENGPU|nr:hypothetical protein GDO81_008228 [Engystomops pustulosus]